jgi:hypothetical protein
LLTNYRSGHCVKLNFSTNFQSIMTFDRGNLFSLKKRSFDWHPSERVLQGALSALKRESSANSTWIL